MPSTKKLNGYRPPTGRLINQSSLSGHGIQTQMSLGFLNSRHPVNLKKDQHLGLHDSWDKGYQYCSEPRWQRIVLSRQRQNDSSYSGILLLIVMTLVAGLATSTVLLNESFLVKLESMTQKVR